MQIDARNFQELKKEKRVYKEVLYKRPLLPSVYAVK